MNKNIKDIEEEIELFSYYLDKEIPNIIERFKWARGQEKSIEADNLYLWKNALGYYREARNCYCCGLYFASIELMSSTIELGFKQIFLDKFPDLYQKIIDNKRRPNLKYYIDKIPRDVISSKLKEQIIKYRSKIRNLVTHPQPHMFMMLGGRELAPGSWVVKTFEELKTPEEAAKEGLIYMLQLCKEYADWKRNHSQMEDLI